MDFRTAFIIFDAAAFLVIAAVITWRVFSLRRNPEPDARNLTPFLPDEDLEGRRLERVLGWALLFTLVLALAVPVYFLYEPTRQAQAKQNFREQSIERGRVLFANKQSPVYDSATSKLCADCHGLDAKGGSATFTLQPEADKCSEKKNEGKAAVPECLPKQVTWQAPDLTLAALRYTPAQITDIITYGRPGTPMQAWGVKSQKGPLDPQSIQDLVHYLESVAVSSKQAQADAAKALQKYKTDATALVKDKQGALADAQAALTKAQADPRTSAETLAVLQEDLATAQAEASAATAFNDDIQQLSDGAILFRLNCARCHTKGWSYHVTEPARTDIPPLAPQGSGAYGPNLTNGAVVLQFPGKAGRENQFNWVAIGVPAHEQYGTRGISSGRMPHFGQALTDEQINEIIDYERSL